MKGKLKIGVGFIVFMLIIIVSNFCYGDVIVGPGFPSQPSEPKKSFLDFDSLPPIAIIGLTILALVAIIALAGTTTKKEGKPADVVGAGKENAENIDKDE